MEKSLRFVWFWTFWHWTKEGSRTGAFSSGPLTAIASHWQDWFQHVASESDRLAIAEAGETEAAQSQFITWIFQHWAPDADPTGNRLVARFVLGQLASVPPFSDWDTLTSYRTAYGTPGLPAVILSENSDGETPDVRTVEAIAIPAKEGAGGGEISSEGFKSDAADLRVPRQLASNLFSGPALVWFFVLWAGAGRRPYRVAWRALLNAAWLAAAGLIAWLLAGPDPGDRLPAYLGTLLFTWLTLVLIGSVTFFHQAFQLWRAGRAWEKYLRTSETRLRMNDGLTVRGGSAGLAFTLNTLLATYRAHPEIAQNSWLWRRIFQALDREGPAWAATGVVTADGWIKPVVFQPKLRACLQHPIVRHILAPRQPDAAQREVTHLGATLGVTRSPAAPALRSLAPGGSLRLGFAAETSPLRVHRCGHIAQALLAVGDLGSRWQAAGNFFALVVSLIVLAAWPDFRGALTPAAPPLAVAPASPSPYFLWVSLDTGYPGQFDVVLESRFWINRRVPVLADRSRQPFPRAEIPLVRLFHPTTHNGDDGTIWVERRRTFLSREYAPGERLGQYSFSYLNRLGREHSP